MKIRAIRLREVGRFIKPVALEGFSGELDVLAGPNEFGKSTILRALRALFLEKHASAATKRGLLAGLRPHTGGAPLIEADFDAQGGRWRLQKQFLAGKSATLTDLKTMNVIARGAEADERAVALTSSTVAGSDVGLGLLWVGQKDALAPLKLEKSADLSLRAAIKSQVSEVADGGITRSVLSMAEEALKDLTGGRGGAPQAKTEFAQQLKKRDEIDSEFAKAQSEQEASAASSERLKSLQARAQALSPKNSTNERWAKLEAAKVELEQRVAAADKRALAQKELQHAKSEFELKTKERLSFRERLESASKLKGELDTFAGEKTGQQTIVDNARTQKEKTAQALELATTEYAQLSNLMKEVHRAEKARAAHARLEGLKKHLKRAQSAAADADKLRRQLSQFKVTKESVQAAQTEAAAVQQLRAEISAALPKVSVAYAKGGEGKIAVDGKRLTEKVSQFEPRRQLKLKIDGVGTITVTPGAASELEDRRADLEAHEGQLGDLLRRMEVDDIKLAHTAFQDRRETHSALERAQAQLLELAPDGLQALVDEVREFEASSGEQDDKELPTLAEVEKQLANAQKRIDETHAADVSAAKDLAEKDKHLTTLHAKLEERTQRLDELSQALPSIDARAAFELHLNEAVADAHRNVQAAEQEVADWSAKAGDDKSRGELARQVEKDEADRKVSEEELAGIRDQIQRLRGALERDAQSDIEARITQLGEARDGINRRITNFKRDRDALQLLEKTLKDVEASTQERFLTPVTDILEPMLARIIPDAQATFADGFNLAELKRDGVGEDLTSLSEGTQEQLAILVRLAFARVLARSGHEVPVILDDPLAYADDERIHQMFDVITSASTHHQVFVLTCREDAFAPLGGTRLELTEWQP